MSERFTKDFLEATFWRAFRTFFQVVASMIVVGATISDINWVNVLSTAAVAAIASIAMSFGKGVPEAHTDGEMIVNENDPNKDVYTISLNNAVEQLATKKQVSLKVVKQ